MHAVYSTCSSFVLLICSLDVGQVWFELLQTPSEDDLGLLDAVLSSWFMIGRLGGFNAMNLQVHKAHR